MSKELESLISNVETGLQKIKDYVNKPPVEVSEPVAKHVKNWESLAYIRGSYINNNAVIHYISGLTYDHHKNVFISGLTYDHHKNVFPLVRQAQSILALSQLLQLRQEFLKREGYQPEWEYEDDQEKRANIWLHNDGSIQVSSKHGRSFLSFPTVELADLFIELYIDLLIEYFDGM